MQLIDEEDDLALALLHLIQDALQTLLELAAVLCASHQSTHVQAEHGAVFQVLRHIAPDDPLGQTLGDGRLADARLTDEAGVVLRLTGQDADDIPNFLVTANDGVQLLLAGQVNEVLTILLQGIVGVLRVVVGHPLVAAHGGELL